MTKVDAFLTRNLRGQSHEFFDVSLVGGQESSDDSSTLNSKLITVGAADLLDDSMCSQHRQRTTHASAVPTLFIGLSHAGIKCRPHVAIAEATHCPFTAIDNLQQRHVGLR